MKKTIPAISIVIPMYNAEKYIGECLDSILAQTFDDYEVIVVDDCSKDNSAAIVESYVPKFKDKLQLVRSKVNSGAPGVPNNTGLAISRGEYISFLEADDAITNTAYEELYPIAKKFDADVVHCEKYYEIPSTGKFDKTNLKPVSYQRSELVKEPTLVSDNFLERVKALKDVHFLWTVWTKLIRRNFIMENNLKMISANAHDFVYTCCLVCSAKRYVRVPNAINFYRIVEDSMSHKQEDVQKTIHKHLKSLTMGFDYINNFLSEQEFFQQRPDAKYVVLDVVIREFANYILNIYAQIPAHQLDGLIRHELANVKDKTALMAFLFARMNIFNVNILQQRQLIQKQQQQIQQLQSQLNQLQQTQQQFHLNTEDIFK